MFNLIYFMLELYWNVTHKFRYPIDYHVCLTDNTHMVLHNVPVGEKTQRFVFISKQISYSRIDRFTKKKVRQYRIEVIDSLAGINATSKIYIIPELCSSVYRKTKIPHVCAINCIIKKFIKEGVNDIREH